MINIDFRSLNYYDPTGKHRKGFSGCTLKYEAFCHIYLLEHETIDDAIDSLYHEYKHVLQYDQLSKDAILKYKHSTDQDSLHYLYSPFEIDARVFTKSRGEISDLRLFEEIGLPSEYENDADYLDKCILVACKYGVDELVDFK